MLRLRIHAPTQTNSIAHTAAPMQIVLLALDSASFHWLARHPAGSRKISGGTAIHPLPSHANRSRKPTEGQPIERSTTEKYGTQHLGSRRRLSGRGRFVHRNRRCAARRWSFSSSWQNHEQWTFRVSHSLPHAIRHFGKLRHRSARTQQADEAFADRCRHRDCHRNGRRDSYMEHEPRPTLVPHRPNFDGFSNRLARRQTPHAANSVKDLLRNFRLRRAAPVRFYNRTG
jgi:hypothetical protein